MKKMICGVFQGNGLEMMKQFVLDDFLSFTHKSKRSVTRQGAGANIAKAAVRSVRRCLVYRLVYRSPKRMPPLRLVSRVKNMMITPNCSTIDRYEYLVLDCPDN
mmetsp:Transcript_5346/g.10202  ORF Transcript_5346/g.10202 Transcript_5346/m.10202 type:complete len:104 (-) Transcript_5346:120-431(-)